VGSNGPRRQEGLSSLFFFLFLSRRERGGLSGGKGNLLVLRQKGCSLGSSKLFSFFFLFFSRDPFVSWARYFEKGKRKEEVSHA